MSTPANGLNARVAAMARKIDETVDKLVENADTPEEVASLQEYRNELHALLLKRAMAESLKGFAQ